MSFDWTDEAWRERWAMLACQREAERAEHQVEVDRWIAQLPEPVVIEQLRVEVPMPRHDEDAVAQSGCPLLGFAVGSPVLAALPPCTFTAARVLGPTVYSQHAGGPDLTDHVPDRAAPDRDPG